MSSRNFAGAKTIEYNRIGTMTTRSEIFERVLSILELGDDAKALLKGQGINSIGKLVKMQSEDIEKLYNDSSGEITLIDCVQMKQFRRWYAGYIKEHRGPPVDWESTFTIEIWESMIPDDLSVAEEEEETTYPANKAQGAEVQGTKSRVKRTLSEYPKFTKGYIGWRKHADNFEAVAVTHKIDYLIQDGFVAPTKGDKGYDKYMEDNSYLHSALTIAWQDGCAEGIPRKFKDTKDGRAAWLAAIKKYESQGCEETKTKKAMGIIQSRKLYAHSPGGADGYISAIEDAHKDLEDEGMPYPARIKKLMFLRNIEDPAYAMKLSILD